MSTQENRLYYSHMDVLNDLASVLHAVFEPTVLKVCAGALLTFVFFFGDVYTDAVYAILMLMIFDTILGIWATVSEGQAITSRRFARVLVKGTVYLMSISAGYYVDQTLPGQLVQSTMIAFVGVTEFISILENAGRLGMETPKKLLNQLRGFQSSK